MPVRVESHMKFGRWHDIEVEDDVTACPLSTQLCKILQSDVTCFVGDVVRYTDLTMKQNMKHTSDGIGYISIREQLLSPTLQNNIFMVFIFIMKLIFLLIFFIASDKS